MVSAGIFDLAAPIPPDDQQLLSYIFDAMVAATLKKLAGTFGPTKYGGLDFRNLKIEQGVKSLRIIMRHVGFP
jgi:hypothetical protein